MKKILLSLFVLIPLFLSAQVTITMEQDGGVYKVPCVVNGAKMKFIFDTGAATVCLSESMAEYLLDNDYISKEDILGLGASQVADGRIVDHVKINLRDVEIAGLHLKDVEAVVVEEQRAPLLLGQTAIQKLGDVTISGNTLYIKQNGYYLSNDYLAEESLKNAEFLYRRKNYEGVIETLSKLEMNNRNYCERHLYDYNFILIYAASLIQTQQYEECAKILKKYKDFDASYIEGEVTYMRYGWDYKSLSWDAFLSTESMIEKFDMSVENSDVDSTYMDLLELYDLYGKSLYFSKKYNEAIVYLSRCDIMYNSRVFHKAIGNEDAIIIRDLLASSYSHINNDYRAKNLCEKNLRERSQFLNITKEDIQNNKVTDEILGACYSTYAYVMYRIIKEKENNVEKANTTYDKCMIMSAKCGYDSSIEYCKKHNLSYFSTSTSWY